MWRSSVPVRVVMGLIAVALAANGLYMLLAPQDWYQSIPSVPHTGPFNAHFVRDIGCAYLACGVGLAVGVWRTRWMLPATLPALTFLGVHAALHAWEALFAHTDAAAHADWIDFLGVYGPPLLILLIIVFTQPTRQEV